MNQLKRVLICDDDEGIIDVASIVLGEKGYDILTLRHSNNIFEKISEYKPDVILIDLWMSEISGDQIVIKLKQDEHFRKIPVIIVSANKDLQEIAKSSGSDGFLAKPFDIVELENIVEKQVGKP